ncbi:MAG TPA: flagellar biosynthetic protein FliO [Anaeromyxobacteraceae bacterium]
MTAASIAAAALARPRALLAASALIAASLAVAALAGGDAGGNALRALSVVAVLGLGGLALRRGAPAPGAPALEVVGRHGLARDTGVAVVSTHGRHLLVGYGPRGVSLVAELSAPPSAQERRP